MRKKQYAWISLHIVIISILLYIENRTCFLFLAEKSEELSFLDKLMTGFLQTIDELSNVSFHFTFDTRSLAGGGFLTLAYGLFVLYKVFDDKNVRPGEEYGSAR
ncbi:type IV secretory system conjugative DNA transfer family protein, partial [Enterococcus durans]